MLLGIAVERVQSKPEAAVPYPEIGSLFNIVRTRVAYGNGIFQIFAGDCSAFPVGYSTVSVNVGSKIDTSDKRPVVPDIDFFRIMGGVPRLIHYDVVDHQGAIADLCSKHCGIKAGLPFHLPSFFVPHFRKGSVPIGISILPYFLFVYNHSVGRFPYIASVSGYFF